MENALQIITGFQPIEKVDFLHLAISTTQNRVDIAKTTQERHLKPLLAKLCYCTFSIVCSIFYFRNLSKNGGRASIFAFCLHFRLVS